MDKYIVPKIEIIELTNDQILTGSGSGEEPDLSGKTFEDEI